ncbi:MAG: PAS domain S-box protein, partial [Pseudomonadota bacterium]
DVFGALALGDVAHDLSLIAQTTNDMVIVMDATRSCTWVNASFEAFTGYKLSEISGQRLDFLKADFIDQAAAASLSEKLDNRETVFVELLCQKKDGAVYLGEFEFQPILDDLGLLKRYVSLHRDVTETRSLELRYASLINEAGLMAYIKHKGRFLFVNSEVATLYNRPPEWFVGRTEAEVQALTGQSLFPVDEEKVLKSDKAYSGEARLTGPHAAGNTHWIRAFRIFDPTLNSYLLCCVANDITPLKRTEQNLRSTQAEALAAEARLRGAIDAMSDGFVLYDRDDVIVMCNQAYRDLHGDLGPHLKPGVRSIEGLGKGLDLGTWDLNGKDKETWIRDFVRERRRNLGQEQLIEFADGRWMLLKNIPLKNGEIVGLRVDLTDLKRSEEDLKAAQVKAMQAQSRLEAAIEALGDAFLV